MRFFSSAALVLLASWARAASPKAEMPGLVSERELKLSLCPVAIDLERDGRIKWVRLAFVPYGLYGKCRGLFYKECRDVLITKRISAFARRKNEPEDLLDIKVERAKQPELLAKLSTSPAVRALRERVDVTWTSAGKGQEYPLDFKRLLRARVRWRVFVNKENLDLLDVLE